MIDLNNVEEIKKLDSKDVYGSTELFTAQCEQIWKDAKITFPEQYKDLDNIILCGMGGSAYGGYVAAALYKDVLRVPVVSNNNYHIPAFAGKRSVVVLSSYSGSTEEVLSCGQEALEKDCMVTGITSGGKLKEFFIANNVPYILFNPVNNPSGQPRLGTGYMVLSFVAMLTSFGLLEVSDNDVNQAITEIKNNLQAQRTKAQEIAKQIYESLPVIFSSEFLNGNAHIMRNQLNETAKSFSAFEDIPELNHHLMEGLKNPVDKKLIVLFLSSLLYSPQNQKRMQLTMDVVVKNGIASTIYQPFCTTQFSQVLDVLSFGGYLSFYLAILYGQDPSVIPWVDYFKQQLAK